MNKVVRYVFAYAGWIADLGLALWLAYLCKTTLLGIFALFYTGNLAYANAVNFIDKAFTVILGLGWLAFMIAIEEYFRTGIEKEAPQKRFASVTGPLLVSIFAVDLILAWVQGISGGSWLRWLILAAELGIGIALLVSVKSSSKSNPN
jgi:hypothetical protein